MTTSAKKEKMYHDIRVHGERLKFIFDLDGDPIALCKKLRRLEVKASRLALDYCNGTNGVNTDNWEEKTAPIEKAVKKLLNTVDNYPIFVNGDARGYALKIRSEYVELTNMKIYRDWGGYGILAPDFSIEN